MPGLSMCFEDSGAVLYPGDIREMLGWERVVGLGEVMNYCASPFMTMALLSLACLPELRLTNRGLVDCRTFTFSDLFLED